MMYKQPQINNNSIGPLGLVWAGVILLKIMEVITWHWLIVICFPIIVVGVVLLGGALLAVFVGSIWQLWKYCTTADKLQGQRGAQH